MADGDVLDERAAVEKALDGLTVCGQLARTVERHGDAPALSWRGPDGWQTLTWREVREQALRIAAGLAVIGVQPGERVAIMAPNRPEHVLADLGILHTGAIPTSLYSTLAPEQIAYVAGHARATVAVLDGAAELARWQPVLGRLPHLRRIVVIESGDCPADERYLRWDDLLRLGEPAAKPPSSAPLADLRQRLRLRRTGPRRADVEVRWQAVTPDDPVTLIYTSGTTGEPKGVVLTHHNVLYQASTGDEAGFPEHPVAVSYLPLAHIAERFMSVYLQMVRAGHIYFCPDATQLPQMIREVRPTMFFGVPRVWEKLRTALSARLDAEPDPIRRAAVAQALQAGRDYVEACQYGRTASPELIARFSDAQPVLGTLRAAIGLDRVAWTGSAAAPLPIDVARFFAGLGLRICDLYGMTETTGPVTSNRPDAFRIGTVGRPVPGIEVRLADDGEILARGPVTTPGYLDRPQETAALLDADGWVHTGDVGRIDAEGFVSVIDRKKELLITSSGKNIAPAQIENLLKEHPLIGQALAYGDGRPYVVALLVLDAETAPAWAAARGIAVPGLAELADHPDVTAEIERAVEAANRHMSRPEQVKRFALLPVEWSAESEELTPTLKLRRKVIHGKYADVIDTLYGP